MKVTTKITRSLAVDGKEPVNPLGSCFDAAATNFMYSENPIFFQNARMCHAIGVSNHPDQLGQQITHAWIEYDDPVHGRCALDPIYMIATGAKRYRDGLKPTYVVEYGRKRFKRLWLQYGYPGPWDEKIKAATPDEWEYT